MKLNSKGLEAANIAADYYLKYCVNDNLPEEIAKASIAAYLPHHESALQNALERISMLHYNDRSELLDAVKIAQQALEGVVYESQLGGGV